MTDVSERLAIQDLTARYSFYTDTFQMEPWLALWSEDGIFDETATNTGYHEGLPALRAFFQVIMDVMDCQVHFGGTHIIDIPSPSLATGILYAIVEGITKQGGAVRAVLYYEDTYCKVDDRWLFKKRRVVPLLPIDTANFVADQN